MEFLIFREAKSWGRNDQLSTRKAENGNGLIGWRNSVSMEPNPENICFHQQIIMQSI